MMVKKLYPYRFELFLATQLAILFGSLIVPFEWFENTVSPLLSFLNLCSGLILVSEKRKTSIVLFILLILVGLIMFFSSFKSDFIEYLDFTRMIVFFLFFSIVTIEIIKQVWGATVVGKNVILGLISGYISLGLLAFFICLSIEMVAPNSFSGIANSITYDNILVDRLMYFSYITLMTIGYGEIIPVTSLAQKATILIGLMGQFYLVILTAIVVGKYISQKRDSVNF